MVYLNLPGGEAIIAKDEDDPETYTGASAGVGFAGRACPLLRGSQFSLVAIAIARKMGAHCCRRLLARVGMRSNLRPARKMLAQKRTTTSQPWYSKSIGGIDLGGTRCRPRPAPGYQVTAITLVHLASLSHLVVLPQL